MGCCCSCLKGEGSSSSETEMSQSRPTSAAEKTLSISRGMSAPSIEVEDQAKASGNGLALAAVSIEQDSAYWEAHVEIPDGGSAQEVAFGVATKKDRKFYTALEEREEEGSPEANGTALMKKIKVSDGDVVGIAVQQNDLPMVQFTVNGEPRHDLAVNRFRGTVFPSIYLPENEGLAVRLVFDEASFKQLAPNARFGPVIVARGLL